MNITRPSEDITRIIIPFLDIDTAVFLVRLGEEYLLFDTATYDTDMTELLFPCLSELGIPEGRAYIGREAIARAIAACHAPLDKIREMILAAPGADDKAIAAAYNQEPLPTLGWPVVAAVRRELL